MKMTSKLIKILFVVISLSTVSLSTLTSADELQEPKLLNINTATTDAIAKALKGIGLKKAQAIVDYRKTYGDFAAIEELVEVKGIGQAIVAKNIGLITIQ